MSATLLMRFWNCLKSLVMEGGAGISTLSGNYYEIGVSGATSSFSPASNSSNVFACLERVKGGCGPPVSLQDGTSGLLLPIGNPVVPRLPLWGVHKGEGDGI